MKDHQNRTALALIPGLKTRVETATDPLIMAVRLAIAGNVIAAHARAPVGAHVLASSNARGTALGSAY